MSSTAHWDVYPWSATGFVVAPIAFTLPAGLVPARSAHQTPGFATMRATETCMPSLVVYQDPCDSDLGRTHWDVYDTQ
jgi:hypothetical protein